MPRSDADICNMALLYSGANIKIGSLADRTAAAQACSTVYNENRQDLFNEFRWPFAIKRVQLTPYSGSTYDASHTYAKGDLAAFGDKVYKSLQAANLNHEPDLNTSSAWWVQVTRDGWAFACPLPADYLSGIAIWEKMSVSAFAVPPIYTFRDPNDFNLRNPRNAEREPFDLENINDGTDQMVMLTDLDTPILKYVADVTNPSVYPTEFVEALAWRVSVALAMGLRGDEKKAATNMVIAKQKAADAFVVSMRDKQEDVEPVSEFEAARRGMR